MKKRILVPFLFLFPILFVYTISNIGIKEKYAIFILIINVIIIMSYWFLCYVFMKIRVPKGFDSFEDEF